MRNKQCWLELTLIVSLVCLANAASAQQTCGDEVKYEVAKLLGQFDDPFSNEALSMQQELYKKYAYCINQTASDGAAEKLRARACGRVPYVGSLKWEQMPCCGYDPQELHFACPIEILRGTGFGAAQLPGSYEHVLVCVDYGSGLVPVARDAVHLADNISAGSPIWNFAALPKVVDEKFILHHFDSETYRARAILAWSIVPQSCTEVPIWGHAVDFQIRLDP